VSALSLAIASISFAQSVVTLQGTTYTLKDFPRMLWDGPGGSITVRVKDPDGAGPLTAPKATADNPAWVALGNTVAAAIGSYQSDRSQKRAGDQALAFAQYWYSDNYRTAARDAALYMLHHIESYVPFVCLETQDQCGINNGGYSILSYGPAYWLPNWMAAYNLMRSEMTPQERRDFAGKILNDRSNWGGTNASGSTSCSNPTAATGANVNSVSGTTVTVNAPIFGTTVNVGDWLYTIASNGQLTRVASILDSTHATTESSFSTANGPLYSRPAVFQPATDCGFVWFVKHDPNTASAIGSPAEYPQSGGSGSSYPESNLVYSNTWGLLPAFLSLTEDDPNAASRSIRELQLIYGFWHDGSYTYANQHWSGFTQSGSAYTVYRGYQFLPGTALAIVNSLQTPPDLLSGNWTKGLLPAFYYSYFPGSPNAQIQWGQAQPSGASLASYRLHGLAMLLRIFAGSPAAAYANYWMRNIWRADNAGFGSTFTPDTLGFTSANLSRYPTLDASAQAWIYLFTDPEDAQTSLDSTMRQKAFNVADGPYAFNKLISRTGFGDPMDTVVFLQADAMQSGGWDHMWNGGNFGSYKILKNNYLLAEDGTGNAGSIQNAGADAFVSGQQGSNYVQLGSDANINQAVSAIGMPRAHDRDPENRFAYAMVDSTGGYLNDAAHLNSALSGGRVHRHLLHLKKPGTQDFVIVYDDVATVTGVKKTTFLHYPANGADPRGTTAYSAGRVTSTYPGTGHNDAAQLLTAILSPAGENTVSVSNDGLYAGGRGNSWRVSMCASANGSACDTANLQGEFLIIHEAVAGIGNSMPETAMLATDVNWRGVEIGGTSPKVALFARKGIRYTAATFTSTHPGRAQIAVAGLAAGSYAIGGPTGGTATAGDDGVLYFEGEAGTYSISPLRERPRGTGRAAVRGKASLK
jgi:hypothetical protein